MKSPNIRYLKYLIILVCLILVSCSNNKWIRLPSQPKRTLTTSVNLQLIANILANRLQQNSPRGDISKCPFIVTTLVNINNLTQTSSFGRGLAEALRTELFKRGAHIIDIMPAKNLFIAPNKGTIILTRRADLIASKVKACAILTGTYSPGPNSLDINLRLISIRGHRILSVAGLNIEETPALKQMLNAHDSTTESGYEKMPSKM